MRFFRGFLLPLHQFVVTEGATSFLHFICKSCESIFFFMIDKQLLEQTVARSLEGTDCYPVEIKVAPGNVITVDIDSDSCVDIELCVRITRDIEAVFDRDVEDYELEVGSAGITSPFKVIRQYQKNIGNEVEVLTNDGRKLHGVLSSVDPEAATFTLAVKEKVKEPGMKRPVMRDTQLPIAIADTKYVKYIINFK